MSDTELIALVLKLTRLMRLVDSQLNDDVKRLLILNDSECALFVTDILHSFKRHTQPRIEQDYPLLTKRIKHLLFDLFDYFDTTQEPADEEFI